MKTVEELLSDAEGMEARRTFMTRPGGVRLLCELVARRAREEMREAAAKEVEGSHDKPPHAGRYAAAAIRALPATADEARASSGAGK